MQVSSLFNPPHATLSIVVWKWIAVIALSGLPTACSTASVPSVSMERTGDASVPQSTRTVELSTELEQTGRIAFAAAHAGGLGDLVTAPCEVSASADAREAVSIAYPSRIVVWHVRPGDSVPSGARVATLESTMVAELRSAAAKARVDMAEQQARLVEEQRMLAGGATSGRSVRETRSALSRARVALDAALRALQVGHADEHGVGGQYDVTTSTSGTVIERQGLAGEAVPEGARLVTVLDLEKQRVVLYLAEDLAAPPLASHAAVQLRGRTNDLDAVVDWVAPTLDPTSRTRRVQLKPQTVPAQELVLDTTGSATLAIHPPHGDAVRIPREAVLREGLHTTVFVRSAAGKYASRSVTTSRENDTEVEVLVGLHAGEQVVTRGMVLVAAEFERTREAP